MLNAEYESDVLLENIETIHQVIEEIGRGHQCEFHNVVDIVRVSLFLKVVKRRRTSAS